MIKESVLKQKVSRRPKKGELCISGKLVVMCTGYGSTSIGYRSFSGVVLIADEYFPIGTYSRTWRCQSFQKMDYNIGITPNI